jgi:hypothetical protein
MSTTTPPEDPKEKEKAPFSWDKWWEEHGEKWNGKRNKRYATDKDYRERVLETNKASRLRRRKKVLKEHYEERKAQKIRLVPRWKTVSFTTDGKVIECVTIGALSCVLDRSILDIRLLEKKGVIPPPSVYSPKGDRLYSQAEVETIRKMLDEKGMLKDRKIPRIPWLYDAKVRLSDGKVAETTLFRVGAVARTVGRSVITLEQMEGKGRLPKTPFLLPPKRRVYALEQVEAIAEAIWKRGLRIRGEEWKSFYDEVQTAWEAAKLVGAELIEYKARKDKSDANDEESAG